MDTDSDACVEVTIDGRAYGTYPLSKDDTIELKEHEAARWLTKESLDSVDWLPADQALIEKIRLML